MQSTEAGRGTTLPWFRTQAASPWLWAAVVGAGSVAAGALVVKDPRALVGLIAFVAVLAICIRLGSIRMIVLTALAGLLPLHVLMLQIGLPRWWKEGFVMATLVLCLPRIHLLFRGAATAGIGLFFVGVLLSALINDRWGVYDLAPYIAYAPLALTLPVLVQSKDEIRHLVRVAGVSVTVNALVVIAARVSNENIVETGWTQSGFLGQVRPGSFAGANLPTAMLLGFATGCMLAWFLLSRRATSVADRLRQALPLGLFLVASLMTLARSAIVPAALTLVVVPIVVLAKRKVKASAMVVAVALAGIMIIGLFLFQDPRESVLLQRFTSAAGANATADATRVERWRSTIELIKERPVVGHGPGYTGFSRVIALLGPDPEYFPDNLPVPVAESDWLKIAAELGTVGLFCAGVLAVVILRLLWRRAGDSEVASILFVVFMVTFLGGAIRPSMETYIAGAFFWSIVGLAQVRDLDARAEDLPAEVPGSAR